MFASTQVVEFFSSRRAGIKAIITAFLQLTRFMSFSMIFRALFAIGRLSLVKGGRELKFEVPKVPKIWIPANQEIRVQVTSYQGIRKNEPDVLIT